ncbi:MAG TPA: nuclear transport factor 2 family protein [Puia sp.]|nr:nuclear transport factor 2 family protein [Puia sp.]
MNNYSVVLMDGGIRSHPVANISAANRFRKFICRKTALGRKTPLLYGKPGPDCLTIKLFMKMTNLFGQILLVGIILSGKAGFAQTITGQTAGLENTSNGKIIKAWYTAWETRDWNLMTQIVADGFTFSSPLDDHIKIDAMKERCWPNAGKIKSADVQQLVMSGDVAFVISNGYNTDGKLFRNCDYFTIKDGKISAYECFFGPGINYPTSGK